MTHPPARFEGHCLGCLDLLRQHYQCDDCNALVRIIVDHHQPHIVVSHSESCPLWLATRHRYTEGETA